MPCFVRIEVEFRQGIFDRLATGVAIVGAGPVASIYVERVAFQVCLPFQDEALFLLVEADEGLWQGRGPPLVEQLGEPLGLLLLFGDPGEEFLEAFAGRV